MLVCNEYFPDISVSLKIHILDKIKSLIVLTIVEIVPREWNLIKYIYLFKEHINIYLIKPITCYLECIYGKERKTDSAISFLVSRTSSL